MYSLTFIANGPRLSEENNRDIEEFVTTRLQVSVLTKTQLSANRVIDFQIDTNVPELVSALVKKEAASKTYDIIFQLASERKNKKLFIFDMDSTLIYQEVIELIAAYADIEDKVAEITERAMNGELDFNDSLRERVLLLKGIDASTLWDELKDKIKITKGARELCKALKKLGVVMGVCSGGFIPLASYVKEQLGLDYAFANTLGVDEQSKLDGTTRGYIVNGEKKAELLLEIASNHNIDPKTAVAVGDGANDLKMMSTGGWGVAWNAKPKVQKEAPSCLNSDSLQDILYIMGFYDSEIAALLT
ncbi:phosphoserine phosphatase serb [Metschnikowia bicuspidata var. bicuspidata NRRL YB-4993]|uniref:phosphoserine phosphatase n=1 Tax=Metschnikowia bicuspidata var. bicuspidata NRRL YB-4993 TaxID=869754 RepID=A0A1A0HHX8_9ASCO|nr:phosphoserine phosphatase serb [Metschnikowia bicuspidata var. bicuspidata NRRL YB-4993]OBA23448.1 phosphoserine phosphatase serb [Metschnikowia bicuspidata var. bicuspidata NRRL YB-4993]